MAMGAKRAAIDAGPVEGPWGLPEGWRWERLGELGEWYGGGTPSKANPDFWTDGTVPWVSAKDMKSAFIDDTDDHITDAAVQGSSAKRIPAGSVLCVMRSGILRHSFPVAVTLREVTINQDLRALKPREDVNPLFVAHFLKRTELDVLHECSKDGTTVNSIDTGRLMARPVPLPSLAVQDHIVARVGELFAEIADGEHALAAASESIETYRRSLLKAAVTGDLTTEWRRTNEPETGRELLERLIYLRKQNVEGRRLSKGADAAIAAGPREGLPLLPETWTWALLPQLGDFGRGKSKHRPRNDPRLYGGRHPFIQTGIVAGCSGVIDRYDQTYSDLGLKQSKRWPAGTVCITIAANIAMTGVLGFDACFPDSLVGLTCFEGVRPEYVELFIRTVQQELELYAPATAQKNINLETLYQLAIPLPPTAEQDAIIEIARNDNGLDGLVDDDLQRASTTLRQSILAAAFRGDLVA